MVLYLNIMLGYYCCITDYQKLSLKQHTFVIQVSMGQESSHRLAVPLLRVSQGYNQNSVQAAFLSGAWDPLANSHDCWQNIAAYNFKTKVRLS